MYTGTKTFAFSLATVRTRGGKMQYARTTSLLLYVLNYFMRKPDKKVLIFMLIETNVKKREESSFGSTRTVFQRLTRNHS